MIGRGTYGKPWFPNRVGHYLATGETLAEPPLSRQLEILLEHYEDMLTHYGTLPGMKVARKHVGWYSKGLPGSAEFRSKIMAVTDAGKAKALIIGFYTPLMERMAA